MVERILITTALENTWPESNIPVLFLGEWCKLQSLKERWIKFDDQLVIPYHWDNRDKLYNDYIYLNNLYENLLPILGQKLNLIHKVNHDINYWRIFIGPWFAYFIQVFFDRFESIKSISNMAISKTIIIDFEYSRQIPLDMKEFLSLIQDDNWNHFIYSYILNSDVLKIKDFCKIKAKKSKAANNQQKNNIFNLFFHLKNLYHYLNDFTKKKYFNDKDAFFISTYLDFDIESKLLKKLNNHTLKGSRKSIPISKIKSEFRNWQINFDSNSNFEKLLLQILPLQIPIAYLESYFKLSYKVKNEKWPSNPRSIFTSNSFESDDFFKHYAGLNKQNGSKLIIGQHGGHYGTGKWSFTEKHECIISNSYLSWGWNNINFSNIIPIGKIKGQKPIKFEQTKKNLLLINVVLPRYSYHMYSVIVSSQYLYYLHDQFSFVNNLDKHIKKSLVIRLFPNESAKWSQKERWLEFDKQINLDYNIDINKSYETAKAIVVNFNATVFLETFSLNIPTLLFWDPKYWELRESAFLDYELLKNVEVLHHSATSASTFLNNNWDNIENWWNSEKVQNAVLLFKNKYVKNNPTIINDLYKILN
jgi:putative transferase (TIGR04331 family)